MALIALATICLLACVFFIYVLVQWTRDKSRKLAGPPPRTEKTGAKSEKRQPLLITSRRNEKNDQLVLRSSKTYSINRQSKGRRAVCSRCERRAHERIAQALVFRTTRLGRTT
jgi:hypothetical protein